MDNLSDPSPNSILNFHAIHFSICLFIDNFIFEYLHGTQKSSKSQHEDVSILLRNIVLGFHSISQYVVLTFMPLCQKKCQKEHKFPFFHNRHPTYFCHLYETLIQGIAHGLWAKYGPLETALLEVALDVFEFETPVLQ